MRDLGMWDKHSITFWKETWWAVDRGLALKPAVQTATVVVSGAYSFLCYSHSSLLFCCYVVLFHAIRLLHMLFLLPRLPPSHFLA